MPKILYSDVRARALMDQIEAAIDDDSHDSLIHFDELMDEADRHFSVRQWRVLEKEVKQMEEKYGPSYQ